MRALVFLIPFLLAAAPAEKCIVVIGAHADDVEQIAGASLAKYISQGYKGVYVVLENNLAGNSMRPGKQEADPLEAIQHRTENARAAAAYYDARPVFFNMHETWMWFGRTQAFTGSPLWSSFQPPGTVDISSVTRRPDSVAAVVRLFLEENPEIVVTHSIGQGNIEHHSAADLVYRAWQIARQRRARLGQLWFQGGDSYGLIAEPAFRRFFDPTRISIDVTAYVDRMFAASALHARNDYEKRKRIALQGQGFDPQKRRPRYFEHFFVVADAAEEVRETPVETTKPLAPLYEHKLSGRRPVVMAVGAHADDIEGQIAVTFSKLIHDGWRGIYVVATNNTAGCQLDVYNPARPGKFLNLQKVGGPFPSDALETIQVRQEEARAAAAVMGAEPEFLNVNETFCWLGRSQVYMDDPRWGAYDAPGNGMVTSAPRGKGLELLTALMRKYQPDLVLAMLLADRNPEHGQTGDLAWRAFQRAAGEGVKVGQIWMPVWRRQQYLDRVRFVPDVSVDVTDSAETNLQALNKHVSQNGGNSDFMRPEPGRKYYEHFINLAKK